MYEYKVITSTVKDGESKMNALANEGWRVITVSPNIAFGVGLIITLERNKYSEESK